MASGAEGAIGAHFRGKAATIIQAKLQRPWVVAISRPTVRQTPGEAAAGTGDPLGCSYDQPTAWEQTTLQKGSVHGLISLVWLIAVGGGVKRRLNWQTSSDGGWV